MIKCKYSQANSSKVDSIIVQICRFNPGINEGMFTGLNHTIRMVSHSSIPVPIPTWYLHRGGANEIPTFSSKNRHRILVKDLLFISLHKSNKNARLHIHTINNGIGCPYVGISSCVCHRSLPLLFTCGRETQLLTFFNKPFGLAFRHSLKPLFFSNYAILITYQSKIKLRQNSFQRPDGLDCHCH